MQSMALEGAAVRARSSFEARKSSHLRMTDNTARLLLRRRGRRHAAEQLGLLAARGRDQTRCRILDSGRDAGGEFLARQPGWQRIEKFDHQRSRIAHEGP